MGNYDVVNIKCPICEIVNTVESFTEEKGEVYDLYNVPLSILQNVRQDRHFGKCVCCGGRYKLITYLDAVPVLEEQE